MDTSFVPEAVVGIIKQASRRGFSTAKALGDTEWVTLYRDLEEDGVGVPIPPQLVLFNDAPAQSSLKGGGEMQKEPPFNVQVEDRFNRVDGRAARISLVFQEDESYITAVYEYL